MKVIFTAEYTLNVQLSLSIHRGLVPRCTSTPRILKSVDAQVPYIVFAYNLCTSSHIFYFLPFIFRAVPMACGSSQARGRIRALATTTAMQDLNCVCNPHHSSQKHWILNPLSKARDQTCNLMGPSRICFHCAMTGTPIFNYIL